jgi:hypothetical protein
MIVAHWLCQTMVTNIVFITTSETCILQCRRFGEPFVTMHDYVLLLWEKLTVLK